MRIKNFNLQGHQAQLSERADRPGYWLVRVDGEIVDVVFGLGAAKELAAKRVIRKESIHCGNY